MITKEQTNILLDQLTLGSITEVTFKTYTTEYEYELSPDDRDWVTFHKGSSAPYICDKLEVCDYDTTEEPVYKDWHMTVNYHS